MLKLQRGLLYNAAVLSASNLGLQALGFVYRIFLSRLAGAEGLGVYHLVFSIYAVMNAACLAGLTMAGARLSAELSAQNRERATGLLLRRLLATFFLFFAICSLILLIGKEKIAQYILGDGRTIVVFPVLLICLGLTGIENIIKSLAIGRNKVHLAAGAELTEQMVRIGAVLLLLYLFADGDNGKIACLIFGGMACSELVSASMLVRLYCTHLRSGPVQQALPDHFMREFWSIVLPVSAAALINNLLGSASSMILPERLMRAGLTQEQALEQIGILSGMAVPLLVLPAGLIGSVCTVLLPEISRSRTRQDYVRIASLSRKAISVTGLIGIPITAALIPLSPTLSRLFFGQPLSLHYTVLLGVTTILGYYQMVTGGLLNGLGAQQQTVLAAISGEVVQLGLTFVLAARAELAIDGYVLAQCAGTALTVLLNIVWLCRRVPIAAQLPRLIAQPLLCGATVFLWVRVFYAFFLGLLGAQWVSILCTALSAAGLCVLMLRVIGVRLHDYISAGGSRAFLWSFY